MNKLVVLSLGTGDLHNGFRSVTAQFWEAGDPHPMKFTGSLPAAPALPQLYRDWQLLYSALYQRLRPRLEIDAADVTNVSSADFSDLCQRLSNTINDWFNSEPFRNIDQHLRTKLDSSQEIRVIIETNDNLVRRLPWHLWNFFEHYPLAELALSAPEYQRPKKSLTKKTGAKVRILAIFGNSKGIDIGKDKAFLEQLSDKAQTEFLVEPQLEELNDHLWEKKGWDILFFAGHSCSQEQGVLQLNQTDTLTLDQLRYALQKAIAQGLKLAIFNSCDGLGLAYALADLHIGQVIVMREPVPDLVAQEFLRHFLAAFSGGQSLYASVREARERLQGLEGEYPCASWLPVICQNPAEAPTSWQELCGGIKRDSATGIAEQQNSQIVPINRRLKTVLLLSVVVTALVMGVRYLGMLQAWELQAFDYLMRQRPAEREQDKRLLVITVEEQDIQYQDRMGMKRRGSLSDRALTQVLEKLESYQPRVIGLDIYRDFPVEPAYAGLITRLRQDNRFFAVCKMSAPEDGDANGIHPPPEVPNQRLGFSDFVVDPDGILRRHLLVMPPDRPPGCATHYALNVQLALRYLEAEGISLQFTKEGYLQLGNVVFRRLKPHSGGYQGVDASGHQVLLNYRYRYYNSLEDIALKVSLTQVLTGQLDPSLVKDRIVLIGVIATKGDDYWSTPYSVSQRPYAQLPGVFAQAQMVSQIVSAVLDKRPLLWVWPQWGEALWVWGWSLLGGAIAWRCRSLLHLGLAGGTAVGVLYGFCFVFITGGGWVPLVPSAIALVTTSGSVAAYLASQPRRQLVAQF
jgi:CHASE2 domain-containing sensor protein